MSQRKTVLIVGGGGREHAIAWKLSQSPLLGELYVAPGNAGIAELAACENVAVDDVAGQVQLARRIGADLVVIGPELPLSIGLVDALEEAGIAAVGPTEAAAQIESSKRFAKEVMEAAGIPTASYDVVTDVAEAERLIEGHFRAAEAAGGAAGASGHLTSGDPTPLVLKADGLAAGKGVVICETADAAKTVARDMLSGEWLDGAGATVVIEQFLKGPEVSLLAFCDGERAVPMPFAQDYKRLGTGDTGPNTGGMGTIAPVPGCDEELHDRLVRTCIDPLLTEMARRGTPFKGILFAGFMLTPTGPMVLEYNARFGDPETQSLLRLLETDLLEIFLAMAAGDLRTVDVKWSDASACCVIMAAKGYPDAPERGAGIEGVEQWTPRAAEGVEIDRSDRTDSPPLGSDVIVFHSGTARDDNGRLISAGGRVLSVTAVADTLDGAVDEAYAAVASIVFPDNWHRTDIGGCSTKWN